MEELFGREIEPAHIAGLLDSLPRGGAVRMLGGAPGIGRSALLTAAGRLAAEAGLTVLSASGSEFEAGISYSFLHQILLPLHPDVQRLPPGQRDAMSVALGFDPGSPPSVLLVGNAALSLLVTAGRKQPVLLLVDDVQWVDRSSAAVLGFVARRIQDSPVGMLVASRTGTESFLDRRGLGDTVVPPLSQETATEFVRAQHPDLPPTDLDRLLELAENNPPAPAGSPRAPSRTTDPDPGPDRPDVVQISALLQLCLDDFLTGRWDQAEELAAEGQQVCASSGLPFLAWYFRYARGLIAAGRGRSDEAGELADEITRWALPRGVTGAATMAHHPRTLAAAAGGDFESAYLHASAISPAGTLVPDAPVATWVMFDLVEAALRTGRTTEARAHAEAMRAAGVAARSARMTLLQHGVDALVLDTEDAQERLESTLADPATDRWLFEASRIRLAFAEKRRRRRAFTQARVHLLAARSGFAAMGAAPWLARATAELRATGYKAVTPEPQTTLTGQEREIAELAASGLSNKQIAERLYLSHRTVGTHLYRIFPKLGISSRAGLRDALSAGVR